MVKSINAGLRPGVLFTVENIMKNWFTNRWAFIRYSTTRGWWVHARYWWYTSKRERIVVVSILIIVSLVVGISAHLSVSLDRQRSQLYCLAINIYHEARGEPTAGKYAVAEVTLNRVRSKHYPNSICKVVHQKGWDKIRKRYVGAFSWTELDFDVNVKSKAWRESMTIAEQSYANEAKSHVNGALFYHATYIKPSWARKKKVKARIGNHIFY